MSDYEIDLDNIPAETPLSPEDAILRRHKKEKKDLQGKIVAMKKACSKDKKKKKELADEIAKLEQELEDRHKLELTAFRPQRQPLETPAEAAPPKNETVESIVMPKPGNEAVQSVTNNGSALTPPGSPGRGRASKAQKRREKKAAEDKERQQRIEAETAELVEKSDWKAEDAKLAKILSGLNLGVYDIQSDGHCLYRALSHQLGLLGEDYTVDDLRSKAADFISKHEGDFIQYLDEGESSDKTFEAYCDQVANTAAWGGDLEIRALSEALQKPIKVLQADGAPLVFGEDLIANTKPLVLTYHRHKFQLGAHYNSAIPATADDSDN